MDGKSVHIRRCHICGTITESSGQKVSRCKTCGKSLSPFYYFDELHLDPISDQDLNVSKIQVESESRYKPIYGLTVLWDG